MHAKIRNGSFFLCYLSKIETEKKKYCIDIYDDDREMVER